MQTHFSLIALCDPFILLELFILVSRDFQTNSIP
jgi:hypothetical protein